MASAHLATHVTATAGERLAYGVLGGGALIGCAALYLVDPASPDSPYPTCPFRALTGGYCPGCGTLRALHQLLRGDVAAAFGYNPLAMLLLPVLVYAGLSLSLLVARGRGLRKVVVPGSWIWGLLGVVLVFWALRNVPAAPFSALAP